MDADIDGASARARPPTPTPTPTPILTTHPVPSKTPKRAPFPSYLFNDQIDSHEKTHGTPLSAYHTTPGSAASYGTDVSPSQSNSFQDSDESLGIRDRREGSSGFVSNPAEESDLSNEQQMGCQTSTEATRREDDDGHETPDCVDEGSFGASGQQQHEHQQQTPPPPLKRVGRVDRLLDLLNATEEGEGAEDAPHKEALSSPSSMLAYTSVYKGGKQLGGNSKRAGDIERFTVSPRWVPGRIDDATLGATGSAAYPRVTSPALTPIDEVTEELATSCVISSVDGDSYDGSYTGADDSLSVASRWVRSPRTRGGPTKRAKTPC